MFLAPAAKQVFFLYKNINFQKFFCIKIILFTERKKKMIKYLKNIKYNNLYKKNSDSEIFQYNIYDKKYDTKIVFEKLNTVDAIFKYKDKNMLVLKMIPKKKAN